MTDDSHALFHLDRKRAAMLLGIATLTLNRALKKAALQGIPSPFSPLDGISGREYCTIDSLRAWIEATRKARLATVVTTKRVA